MAQCARQNRFLDAAVIDCLLDVMHPQVGLNVIDLGLVYHASRYADGIDVLLTLTTRACPLGLMIVEEARERIATRFPDAPRISVHLVWNPPWNPDLVTDRGRELLSGQLNKAACCPPAT